MRWPFVGRRERVRRQAADWIAKLNGPHDERERAAFERWYRADPDHAAAFDRQSALFDVAEGIRPLQGAGAPGQPGGQQGRSWSARYAFAAVAATVFVVVLAFAVLGARDAVPSAQGGVQVAVFAATASDSRQLRLADGSEVVLAPGSELAVSIDDAVRRLRLTRGEGRFTVFHEARPFVVTAARAEIVARGTEFVVRIGDEGTTVSLVEGRVEVSYPPSANPNERRVASLTAGQRLVVPTSPAPLLVSPVRAASPSRPAMIEFDDTPLADAVEQINRHAAKPIRLADPALGELRVTGAFRVGDAEEFAESVAAALGLEVERGRDGGLWLRHPRTAAPRR